MWKTTSKGVTSRLRIVSLTRPTRHCASSDAAGGSTQASPDASVPKPQKPREYEPPNPPKKKKGIFGKLLGVTVVGLGGAIAYAWYDEAFRSTVTEKVPYGKDVLEGIFVYLPDSPSVPAAVMTSRQPAEVKPKAVDMGDTKQESFYKPHTPSEAPPTPDETVAAPTKLPEVREEPKPEPAVKKETAAEKREREKKETQQRLLKKQEEEKAENAALEIILENIMSTCTEKYQKAMEFQEKVIETTNAHKQLLKTAMEDTSKILEKDSQWQSVSVAYELREEAKRISEETVTALQSDLEKLHRAIDEGRKSAVTKKNKALITANESMNKFRSELNKKISQVTKAESEARVMIKYVDLIEKGKQQFKKELESIMPDVKLGDKKGKKLTEDELNSLIAHAHRRIEQLQKQLAEQIAMEQQRIEKALEEKGYEDEKLADNRLAMERDKLQAEIELSKEKWNAEAQVQFELELRKQLARQAAAHSQHLQEVLSVREKELLKRFEHQLHGKLIEERGKFSAEISGWVARLRGIEQAVEAHAESEKTAVDAQALWLACVALNGALREGNPEEYTWEKQLRPLSAEVKAVEEASRNHPFVKAVLFAIPDEALTKGVWTEENLKKRFSKVQRVAKQVAMIDETGGTPFRFFLSYLQSFLLSNNVSLKSETDEMKLDELGTFELLTHADYWFERGDMEQCLRFMNQLRGESRKVAADWIEATRTHLETKQAILSLMAFASARGLGTIF